MKKYTFQNILYYVIHPKLKIHSNVVTNLLLFLWNIKIANLITGAYEKKHKKISPYYLSTIFQALRNQWLEGKIFSFVNDKLNFELLFLIKAVLWLQMTWNIEHESCGLFFHI